MTLTFKKIDSAFTITTYGVTLGDFNDWAGNNAKIAALKNKIEADGSLKKLLALGDGQLIQVNSADAKGGPYRGFGVKGDFGLAETVKVAVLAKEHAVFAEIVSSEASGADEITGKIFSGLIGEVVAAGYKYVGPYNFTTVTKQADDSFVAEMWLPVEKA